MDTISDASEGATQTYGIMARPLTSLGRVYLAQERFSEAERALREAYDVRRGGLPPGHWEVAATALDLGRALDGIGRMEEAERYLEESHSTLLTEFGAEDPRTVQARDALREHLLRRGLDERAARLSE